MSSSPPDPIKRRAIGAAPQPRVLPRRARRPLYAGQKPGPAERQPVPWYLRWLDPRIYLRLAITVVVVGAVSMMLVLSRQHLMQQWQAQPERKIAPEPRVPLKHGSSPRCGPWDAMRRAAVSPQTPAAPARRSVAHWRGQRRQGV